MLSYIGKVVRDHSKAILLGLALLLIVVAGTGVGFYLYALHQWHAAELAVKEGRPSEALRSLDLCLLVWPQSVPVHLLTARAARLSGDYDAAEAHLNQCLKLQKGDASDIQLEFLLMRAQTGEEDEVAPLLVILVDNKHPETPLILKTLSRAYMHKLRYGPAFLYLDRWIREEPDSAEPLHWRGWVLERLNNAKAAMDDYQQALKLDPELLTVRLRVAEMLLEDHNPVEALPHLQWLNKKYPDRPDVMARLGQCRFLQGQEQEARSLLEAAVAKLPDDPALLLYLAKLELQDEKPAEAELWLRRLLKVDPFDTDAEYTLSTTLRQQNREEEAAAVLEQYEKHKTLVERANKLLKKEAEHPSKDPEAACEAGVALLNVGQDRLGLYWLNQALERSANYQPAHKALAEYFEKKGAKDQAAAHRRFLNEPDKKTGSP